MTKQVVPICCAMLLLGELAWAQQAVSARSQGMDNSSVSALGDSESIFLNPAALPWLQRSKESTEKNQWGGQAVTAFGVAEASGLAAPVNAATSFLVGAGITNGRHGFGVYVADLNLLTDKVSEVGLGYGFSFMRHWALGAMVRLLDRPGQGMDFQLTEFTIQYNRLVHNRLWTATFLVHDYPYDHTPDGSMIDFDFSGYVSEHFLITAQIHDVSNKVHRLLNVGGEIEVRPDWFIRSGFEEKPRKVLEGISVGVGHRVKDWRFDVALTKWQVRPKDMNLGLGVTGGATVAF
jgi:hypothetical protein